MTGFGSTHNQSEHKGTVPWCRQDKISRILERFGVYRQNESTKLKENGSMGTMSSDAIQDQLLSFRDV